MIPESQIYQETTDTYLDGLPMDVTIDPKQVERELLEAIIYLSFRIFSIRHNADQKSSRIQKENENKRRIPA